jgi:hypothetical protein
LAFFGENLCEVTTVIPPDRAFDGVLGAVKKVGHFGERGLNGTKALEGSPIDLDAFPSSLAHFQIPPLC